MFSPRNLDLKSLALHHLVAKKIRSDPLLFVKAHKNLERLAGRSHGAPVVYATAWLAVFDQGLEEALAVATSDTERGQAMRSTSPFCGVLTEDERVKFLNAYDSGRRSKP